MNKPFSLVRLLVTAGLVLAAGSGCAKPTAAVEKIVVSDPKVAALDAQLNAAYTEALRHGPAANTL